MTKTARTHAFSFFCIFQSGYMVRHFQVLYFAITFVRHFRVLHFQALLHGPSSSRSCIFSAPHVETECVCRPIRAVVMARDATGSDFTYGVPYFSFPAFSIPAFTTLCSFFVPHFQFLHVLALHFCATFSSLTFSTPCMFVPHFPVRHFHVSHFQRPHRPQRCQARV